MSKYDPLRDYLAGLDQSTVTPVVWTTQRWKRKHGMRLPGTVEQAGHSADTRAVRVPRPTFRLKSWSIWPGPNGPSFESPTRHHASRALTSSPPRAVALWPSK